MIIAAYAGSGKTTFAKKHSDVCAEAASMPYARILPIDKEETTKNFEREKAAEYHVSNPIYPYNMIADVLELEKHYKYVIIPTVPTAIEILQKDYKRNVILCYPEDGSEEEYRKRYEDRGNTETFCQIFADGMQDFLNQFKRFSGVYHIVLKRKEFLEDKFCELEDIYREVPVTAVNTEEIELLKAFIKEKKDTIWLDIDIFAEHVLYQVKDVDDADERRFIYDFAKNLYESDCMGHIWAFDFDLRELCKGNYKTGRVVDKTELRQILMKK